MRLRRPILIWIAACLAALVLRLWRATLAFRVIAGQPHPADPTRQRYIYAFWHEALLAPATFKRGDVSVLISRHADGELIARVCAYLGFGVIRGSTKRGGAQALMEMIRAPTAGHLAITPDGPRGPRRQVQTGIVLLASCTGLPILPVGVGFSRAWRARSWDRFALPKPFSRITGVADEAIHVPPNLSRHQLEEYRRLVEARLLAATRSAEEAAAARGRRAAA